MERERLRFWVGAVPLSKGPLSVFCTAWTGTVPRFGVCKIATRSSAFASWTARSEGSILFLASHKFVSRIQQQRTSHVGYASLPAIGNAPPPRAQRHTHTHTPAHTHTHTRAHTHIYTHTYLKDISSHDTGSKTMLLVWDCLGVATFLLTVVLHCLGH